MRRSHETLGNTPLSQRDRLLIERVAAALAAYYGTKLSDKHRAMAQKLLRNKPVDATRQLDITSMVG
jgi:hypothetical protein